MTKHENNPKSYNEKSEETKYKRLGRRKKNSKNEYKETSFNIESIKH
jgi:hypothetical protein